MENDDINRREEEELQRVLALSMQDKGGRSGGWGGYSASPGASGSSGNLAQPGSGTSSSRPNQTKTPVMPTGGYQASPSARKAVDVVHEMPSYSAPAPAPAATPAAAHAEVAPPPVSKGPGQAFVAPSATPVSTTAPPSAVNSTSVSTAPTTAPSIAPAAVALAPAPAPDLATATRVRALHSFEPADAGELAFDKGDVIRVVDRTHKDWWKGQLKGRTGIFPVNYVVGSFYYAVHWQCLTLK